MLRKIIPVAAITVLLMGPAYSQSLSLIPRAGDTHRSPEEIERDKAIERDYNEATKKIPDKKAPSDPWGAVRSSPSTSSASKQRTK
jgi:hypothetical protein